MRRIVVGIKGPTGILRAESENLDDAEANRQLEEIARAHGQRKETDTPIRLPWLWVRGSDVLYARTYTPRM